MLLACCSPLRPHRMNKAMPLESMMLNPEEALVNLMTLIDTKLNHEKLLTQINTKTLQAGLTNLSLNQTTLSIKSIVLRKKLAIKAIGAPLKRAPIGKACLMNKSKDLDERS